MLHRMCCGVGWNRSEENSLMPHHPTIRQRLAALLDRYEPELRAAFMAAIDDIRSQAEVGRIAALLERGDIDGAIRAVHLDPAAFRAFERAIADAYMGGGTAAVAGLPALTGPDGGRVILRFNSRSPRAERWLTQHSSTLVTRIVEDQRTTIRTALTEGMALGNNPRTTALNVVGRINRATGRREGGLLGLSAPQERYVANARAELLSGDPERLRAFLGRVRRDKRFDRTILKAINDGTPVPRETVNRIIGRYSDSLLQLRGETIARTEAIASLNQSRTEAMRQAIDTGAIRREDVRKVWISTKDGRTRDSHRALDTESVGLDERFSNGLEYPGDPMGDVSEVANCRCVMLTRIDFLANVQ